MFAHVLKNTFKCNFIWRRTYFKASSLTVNTTTNVKEKPFPNRKIIFGHEFTDHMLKVHWSQDGGWQNPEITELQNFSLHPAVKVFHYAVEVFEGMKAFRGKDGTIRLFRPELNMRRMKKSVARSALPDFDGEEFLECIKRLVNLDRDWIPSEEIGALYIRPTAIAIEPTLGVSVSNESLLYVILCPVSSYFSEGFKPVRLYADPTYVRAWPGGCGALKMGSNYAPTINILKHALSHGCEQVLWMLGENERWTEVGTMNVFVFWINREGELELITPSLYENTILPGVMRESILELTREWGEFKVTEGVVPMKEVLDALHEDRICEVFGCGTACVVCPVGELYYMDKVFKIPCSESHTSLSNRLLKAIADIQYGRVPTSWTVEVN